MGRHERPMLKISRTADYGIVLATRLAALRGKELRSVSELALETGISSPTVSKILKGLSRSGVVTSERGARGGYRLVRSPQETSVAEIIEALEGPIGITECVREDASSDCEFLGRCDVHGNWQRINEALQSVLRQIPIADMARRPTTQLVTLSRNRSLHGMRPARSGT